MGGLFICYFSMFVVPSVLSIGYRYNFRSYVSSLKSCYVCMVSSGALFGLCLHGGAKVNWCLVWVQTRALVPKVV